MAVAILGYGASMSVASAKKSVYNLPAVCSGTGSQTVTPTADSWISQNAASTNYGTDVDLQITSKNAQNARSLVTFSFPALPAGCWVTDATLRLYAKSSSNGRTIDAYRINAAWTETGVTWGNQPGTTGTGASNLSGSGWQTWPVTAHVQTMYTESNLGFILIDASEDHPGGRTQVYASREDANDPELVVTWG
jgi:hypothetical protein